MNLLAELRRRKVFRVGLAYLVAAWLVAQVAELVADSFGAPDWFMQLLLVVLALGLPLVLFLAWAFELTPEGLVRDADVSPAASAQSSRLLTGLTIVLLALALGYFVWESRFADPAGSEADAGRPGQTDGRAADVSAATSGLGDSIAVLPFESFSADPADTYFADGLADTLLHKLAQIEDLRVIARNSSFQFRGSNRDIREIGAILDVDTVLEGSVQRAGDQVRIIAQLVRTADGAHAWSKTFDGSMEDIFALQDQVAEAIAGQLQVDLTAEERRRMLRNGTDNPTAYDLLMRALNEGFGTQDLADADESDWPPIAMLRQAIELDPDYAQAWAGLSTEYNFLAFRSGSAHKSEAYIEQSRLAAERAVELDPDGYLGYMALGWVAHRHGRSLEAARYFRRALELEPNSVGVLSGLALQLVVSDPEEALRLFERVQSLEPTAAIVHRQKHFALSRLGRYDEAIGELEAGIAKAPEEGVFYRDLADLLIARRGRPDQAARRVSELLRLSPDNLRGLEVMAFAWQAAGDDERAAAWAALILSRHAALDRARLSDAERLVMAGAFEPALQQLEKLSTTAETMGDAARVQAVACIGLGRTECAEQQLRAYGDWIEAMRARGAAWVGWTAARDLLGMLAGEAAGAAAARPMLEGLEAQFQEEAAFFERKSYARAGVAARLGDMDRAMALLEEALSAPGGGIYSHDLLGYPVEVSPLLGPLRGAPGFEDWLQRFRTHREALRERMVRMEAASEILPAAAVERLNAIP